MALAERFQAWRSRVTGPASDSDIVLGDEWVGRDDEGEAGAQPAAVRLFRDSPLARKIVVFNLFALFVLLAGILYLNDGREGIVKQRAGALIGEAELIADVFQAELPENAAVGLGAEGGFDAPKMLMRLTLRRGVEVLVFDSTGAVVAQTRGTGTSTALQQFEEPLSSFTPISNVLSVIWTGISRVLSGPRVGALSIEQQLRPSVRDVMLVGTQLDDHLRTADGSAIAILAPIEQMGEAVGAVAVVSAAGEVDALVRVERERVLRIFIVATLVSVGLSLVLASTIANPISDLSAAAEMGRDSNARRMNPGRVRIPDLTARPDEIGRLSGALRGMISALYSRIESNEQFAADVAHEIKNPLASLRSAVGTMRLVKREDQREKLLEVIEHDVRRLDRLVSDISNASRLDSDLVKEEEEEFNLLDMLSNLNQYLGEEARTKGIDYITDVPRNPIIITGLEARLAQVFVNLITNAISFCDDGDAIRVWARKRENRVLVVVEDTGPGIPEQALTKIFKRFYSQRPDEHFGNNSGLGLAISKQIVEAHGGVIWAENIRPTVADVTSEPLGARFVVGLPV